MHKLERLYGWDNPYQSQSQEVTVMGMFVQIWMMHNGIIQFEPGKTRNLGELVDPAVPLDWTNVTMIDDGDAQISFENRWVVLYQLSSPCSDICREQVIGLRQLHIASGRNQHRIRVALMLDPGQTEAGKSDLLKIYPQFRLLSPPSGSFSMAIESAAINLENHDMAQTILLVDPLGNIMMTYNGSNGPGRLNKDLKRLLTWSKLDN